jgi:hypothetical protein
MNNLGALCYIQEQTSYPEDYKNNFGYTVHDRGNRFFLTFPAILQSFGVLNRNKRSYLAENIMDKINNDEFIQDMLRRNSWWGEIDHPAPEFIGQELTMNRIANPDLKMTSHYIRSPKLNGNLLEANIQTDSSNEHGMNMAIKIVDGKIIPAFSARVLGELKNIGGRPIVMVRKLITYDFVGYPSHSDALGKINQPVMESVNIAEKAFGGKIIFFDDLAKMAANNSKETQWLCESFGLGIDSVVGLTNSGNSLVIQENKNIYVQPISDKTIRAKTKRGLSDWLTR